MTIAEAVSYMRGQDRRQRQGWEQTRLLGQLIHKILTGKDWGFSFPWDDESAADKEMTPEELQEMYRKAEYMMNLVKSRGGNL